jgi:hypothetical protein
MMTNCCYARCCFSDEHSYRIYASKCSYSLARTTDTCLDYRATQCCPLTDNRYYTKRYTCCSKSPTALTYTRCPGSYYTDYCTKQYKTFCCYSSCCDQYMRSRVLKTCGQRQANTCYNYRSTQCCGRSYRATCCASAPPTYTSCSGIFYTDTCTDSRSTRCCYSKCCDWSDLVNSISTCGRRRCSDYRSTYCCTPGNSCCNRHEWIRSSMIFESERDDEEIGSRGEGELTM